ncbi:MAG TPA: hypothetical protein PK748_05600 [Acidimicrobiales bacterium]|jgi:hypothetical protein|nr:hypothetical protein [Acidimicrobiales bacterium]HMS88285.1 hypothetical protein [Acidimicrobiales bacterium]HRA34378.1 hypothetical protein [Acidimicrobiales bacterium]
MNYCQRHTEELSTGECRSCHGSYCARCLVYSFGPKKPPFCVGCALRASGVRSGAKPTFQPQQMPAAAVAAFNDAPALFGDPGSNQRHDPPGGPQGGLPASGTVKSGWAQRRSQRQAAKSARRSADAALATPAASPNAPMSAENLEPVLSPGQRHLLGQLAGEAARV